jgi:suppressor of G2 allele of SKP1
MSLEKADNLFADDFLEEALELYSQILGSSPQDCEVLSKRAAVLLKLQRFPEALEDASLAVELDPFSAPAIFRKAMALFRLERLDEAREQFELARRAGYPNVDSWIAQCGRSTEGKEEKRAEDVSDSCEASLSKDAVSSTLASKMKFAWVQKPESVSITFYAKNLSKEHVKIEFESSSVSVSLSLPDKSVYSSRIELFSTVIPGDCSFDVTKFKVIVNLKVCPLS